MTPFKYYIMTCTSLLVFASAFATGWFVGRSFNKKIMHSHVVTVLTLPDDLSGGDYSGGKKLMVDEGNKDLDCLAKTIYFEAGNQSYLGKLAVARVVLNRVKDAKYPNTICDVIYQKKQFSWVDRRKSHEPKSDRWWKESLDIAGTVIEGQTTPLFDENVTHYHADYVNPKWAKELKQVAKIDQHIFYKR